MKATDFEYRHQTLIHQFIVAAAFLIYLVQRDDIVWRFVKDSTQPRELERSLFAIATLFIAAGAAICISARAYHTAEGVAAVGPYRYLRHPRHIGDLVYAIGLGSLAPLWGFVILVAGEGLRVFRVIRREDDHSQSLSTPPPLARDPAWGKAFRQEAIKCGIFLTMIVFLFTLNDRIAEILLGTSFLIGLLANAPVFSRSTGIDPSS